MKFNKEYLNKIKEIVQKTGYGKVAMLLAAGIILVILSIPGNHSEKKEEAAEDEEETVQEQKESEEQYAARLEKRLQAVLKDVDGVGEVEVMITLKSSSETILNKDTANVTQNSVNEEGEGGQSKEESIENNEETVMVEKSDGSTSPYVVKEIQPEIEGILVICEGGDKPLVVNEITSAAEVLFSVSAHKVKVMKKLTT